MLPHELYKRLVEWHWETTLNYPDCEWVCHYRGKRLRSIRHPFERAVKQAGLDGSLIHDFRRSALRNYTRAGTSRQVAKAITGHRTDSAFHRYDIVNDLNLENAVINLEEYLQNEKSA